MFEIKLKYIFWAFIPRWKWPAQACLVFESGEDEVLETQEKKLTGVEGGGVNFTQQSLTHKKVYLCALKGTKAQKTFIPCLSQMATNITLFRAVMLVSRWGNQSYLCKCWSTTVRFIISVWPWVWSRSYQQSLGYHTCCTDKQMRNVVPALGQSV